MKIIVMAANQAYLNPLTTAIKSILYNNQNIEIRVFNSDIPQEWFRGINGFVHSINDLVTDIKIDPNVFQQEISPRVNNISYSKFLVPKYIPEKRAIWIDSDMIIDDNIDDLFTMDMKNNDVAAVKEVAAPDYNSGLIVFNLAKLHRQKEVTERLLAFGQSDDNDNGDQTVFNRFFKNSILELPLKYNFQVGHGYNNQMAEKNKIIMNVKKASVYHYLTNDKPWHLTSYSRNRGKWWQYYNLQWTQIIDKCHHSISYPPERNHFVGRAYTLTADQHLANVEELVQKLPHWQFNIGAYTFMGFNLIKLLQYPNVRLYPNIIEYNRKKLMKNCDIYLDINYGKKYKETIKQWQRAGKPVLTFKPVASKVGGALYREFELNDVTSMIKAIQAKHQ